MKRIAIGVALAGSLLLALTVPTIAAERRCGTLTAVALSDPISGGTVTIDGRVFRVAGLGRNVQLAPVADLRVGVAVCAEGDFRVLPDGSVDLTNGSVTVGAPASTLPSTAGSQAGDSTPWLLGAAAAAAALAALLIGRAFAVRHRGSPRNPLI